MEFTDKVINCVDCNAEVELSAQYQQWFADRKLHQPTRCAECIKRKREEREAKNSKNFKNEESKAA